MEECEPCDTLDIETEWRELVTLPAVKEVKHDVVKEKATGGRAPRSIDRVICTMWCSACHPAGDLRQPAVKCNQSTVPTLEHAVRALRLKIVQQHSGCLAAAEAARAAAAAPATQPPPDAIAKLMATASFRRADAKAKAAIKLAKELRVAADAEEAALQGGEQSAKRQRVDVDFWKPWLEATPASVAEWDISQWRTQEDEEQKRRAVKLVDASGSTEQQPLAPRTGKDGYLQHWRRGLIGAVQSWARGSKEHAISMVVALCSSEHGFGIEQEVRERLAADHQRKEAEINALIVDRVVEALAALRQSGSEQARHEYHIVLSALAPKMAAAGNRRGMSKRVAARLRVLRGRRARTKQQQEADEPGRPFAFLASTIRRAAFDAAVEAAKKPLRVGDAVLARGQPGTLMSIHGRGCVVEFRVGEVYEQVTYAEMDGKAGGKGNARLTRPPPSLAPDPRAARSGGITPEIVALVRTHVEAICARSPHQRDSVCRRIATHLKQEAQALILTETRDELFESFQEKHPDVKLKRTKFYEVLPWELKEARCSTARTPPDPTRPWLDPGWTLAGPWLGLAGPWLDRGWTVAQLPRRFSHGRHTVRRASARRVRTSSSTWRACRCSPRMCSTRSCSARSAR
jgi:hypothetical protein